MLDRIWNKRYYPWVSIYEPKEGRHMSKVRLFSFDRFAKFGDTLINPSDIIGAYSFGGSVELYYDGGVAQCGRMSLEEVEAEINRALEATHKAHMDVAEEAKEKVQKLMNELNKPSTKVDPFSMNDFYCDPTKDKN